jgi:hypothetical protein
MYFDIGKIRSRFARRHSPALLLSLFACVLSAPCNGRCADLPKLETFVEVKAPEGKRLLVSATSNDRSRFKMPVESRVLRAVTAPACPEGLVPIFLIETDTGYDLRRFPRRGQENSTDPIFFALPRPEEHEAPAIAGRWDGVATNGQGTQHYVTWELAAEGERLAGRFDQQTDYRFAFITGGTFRSNHFELKIDYQNAVYTMTGEWRERRLTGTWRTVEGNDGGSWAAKKFSVIAELPSTNLVANLYEWRKRDTTQRRYSLDDDPADDGWQRTPLPLCRVWRPADEK